MTSTSTSLSIIGTAKCTHVIDDFSSQDSSKWSSEFTPPKHSSYKFFLRVYPKSTFSVFKDDTFFCLWISTYGKEELSVQYRVSILDANGVKHCTKEVLWNYTESDQLGREHSIIKWVPRDYLLDPTNGLLPDDKLTIYCEVDVLSNKIPHIHDGVTLQPKAKVEDNLQKDFESLLENGKLSDVVLVVGEKEIHAHKNILSTRSKVFGAMFENKETKESIENRVEFIDVDVEVFEELLLYIYTGKIPETDKNALELFMAADKYELDHLKSICEQTLCSTLTTESVVSTLMVADMHQAAELKSKCIEYITEHSDKVRATDGWSQFVAANQFELLNQLFEAMSVKFAGKN